MSDLLKKPVHPIFAEKTPLESAKAKFGPQPASIPVPERQPLPAPQAAQKPRLERLALGSGPSSLLKQESVKRRLRLFYDALPASLFPEEKTPPCSTCKTSPCCSSFIVPLRKEEYESGSYAQYAVKIESEALKQLANFAAYTMLPNEDGSPSYYIEGTEGEACPFLGTDYKCTIYEDRPLTCREYTCVGDSRITQEMRDGL